MKPVDYPEPFQQLARQLRRLPSIGPRSAERIALWLCTSPDAHSEALIDALSTAARDVRACARCGFFAIGPECAVCADPARAGREICVVETATDVLPMERTGFFHGRYHALGGRLAPLENIGPEDLRIDALVMRIADERPTEIILALSADVEGEATANYLSEVLAAAGVPVTRIAQGLPAGGGLEHADQLTLQRALAGRIGLRR
ncbi:MAG: recombination mediator RecR [Terrimicrobiaceae bacterium]|nr:recombination mediator RecR [Terrimicrobiaceae bacterium]